MSAPGALNPTQRAEALGSLAHEHFDVLVIGGGVVGAGTALDAASRGLRVALIEARDFAAGTSSRSTKLFHGGLRYLEHFEFGLVREALHERSLIMQRLAPHMARPLEILYPLRRFIDRPYVGMGIGVYEAMGARRGMPRSHQHVGRRATQALFPSGNPNVVRGGVLFHEAQVDDARHTLALVRTAAAEGAVVASSVRAESLVREDGRVRGARVQDIETGHQFTIEADCTVTAVGVWTQDVVGPDIDLGFRVRASKGVHITVPRDRIDCDTAIISRTDKSVLFIIPWEHLWVIGTTDTPWDFSKAHPAATSTDIGYLLDEANELLRTPLTRDDIVGVYAGLRPLVDSGEDDTAKASREHAVTSPVPGLVATAGGKYTTYRVMAQEAVDACRPWLAPALEPSQTENLTLIGSRDYAAAVADRGAVQARLQVDDDTMDRLLRRHGTDVRLLADYVDDDPALAEPLAAGYLRAEVHHAVVAEGALHLDDVLARRTRLSIETPDRGVEVADEVSRIMAPLLDWSEEQRAGEVASYRDRVAAEIASQQEVTDADSDRVRTSTPDSRNLAS